MDQSANIICCGLFHYRNYVERLAAQGMMNRFYFSHKRSTFAGLPWAKNFWFKEYAVRLLDRTTPDPAHDHLFPLLHDYWDMRVARSFEPTAITHVMLHGTSRRIIAKARSAGSVIIGEAVNTHPDSYHAAILHEARVCKLEFNARLPRQLIRLRNEIENCDWLLAPSSHVAQSFIERGFPAERVICLPYGANVDLIKPPADWQHRAAGPMRVVCVAQVIPRKGIHYLLEAWRQLGIRPDVAQLRILGRVSSDMRGVIARAPPGIRFLGAQGRSTVIEELQAASVFVLPTVEEGFAISILEAMAAGCAVITTNTSGAESVICSGENGILIPCRDVDSLRQSLRSLFDDPAQRLRLGRAAVTSVQGRHNWNNYAQQLSEFYTKNANSSECFRDRL